MKRRQWPHQEAASSAGGGDEQVSGDLLAVRERHEVARTRDDARLAERQLRGQPLRVDRTQEAVLLTVPEPDRAVDVSRREAPWRGGQMMLVGEGAPP